MDMFGGVYVCVCVCLCVCVLKCVGEEERLREKDQVTECI